MSKSLALRLIYVHQKSIYKVSYDFYTESSWKRIKYVSNITNPTQSFVFFHVFEKLLFKSDWIKRFQTSFGPVETLLTDICGLSTMLNVGLNACFVILLSFPLTSRIKLRNTSRHPIKIVKRYNYLTYFKTIKIAR